MLPRLLLQERFISFSSSFENLFFKLSPSIRRFSSSSSSDVRRDIFSWNSAIMSCFRTGEVDNACKMFDEMPHRNTVTWNCMITGYVKNFMLSDAQSIFDSMPHRNVVSYASLMTGYLRHGRVDEARKLFDNIPERNVVCWNSLISGYINNGRIREARKLFNNMPSRNTVSWSTMISAYIHQNQFDEAFNLFARMECRDPKSWNSMITCYSRAGKMDRARQLFDKMPEKDVISWTAIIRGHLQNGNVGQASRLFEEMPSRDVVSWNTMVGGFVRNGLLDNALKLFDRMPHRDIVSWNTILQGFVDNNDMFNARRWFENMPYRSETSWNTLISGYQTVESLGLFCDMVKEGLKPDQVTLVIVISVCGSLVALGWGRMIHLYVIKTGYEHDIVVESSLISMYSRCGFVEDSSKVFERMSKRDTIAWNAMISTYAYHGFAKEAIELYKKMIQSNFHPDHATFLNLLLGCSHNGLIDEGFRYFMSMREEWKLDPRAEHYSCLVDLLGRHGFIVQAYRLTEKVPEDLQTNSWETLLSACQVHQDLEVGERTAKRVFEKKNCDGGMHVLLSNIYAAKGKWSEASQIRRLMREQGLKKETGCAWIEVKGKIFYFVSNDRSNPQVGQICRELDSIFLMLEGTC